MAKTYKIWRHNKWWPHKRWPDKWWHHGWLSGNYLGWPFGSFDWGGLIASIGTQNMYELN